MSKDEFRNFVSKTLDELVRCAEIYADKKLSFPISFKWVGGQSCLNDDLDIINEIVERVYVDENHIYPCVDLVVMSVKHQIKIEGRIAGYEPRPFQKGWSGRMGPFIYGIGFSYPIDEIQLENIRKKLINQGLLPN